MLLKIAWYLCHSGGQTEFQPLRQLLAAGSALAVIAIRD